MGLGVEVSMRGESVFVGMKEQRKQVEAFHEIMPAFDKGFPMAAIKLVGLGDGRINLHKI